MCHKLGSGPYRSARNTAPLPNRNLLYETALGDNSVMAWLLFNSHLVSEGELSLIWAKSCRTGKKCSATISKGLKFKGKNGPRKVKFLVRIGAIVIPKNPKGQVAWTSRLARRSLRVRAV